MMWLAILIQTVASGVPPVPQKFSILAPVASQPCTRQPGKDADRPDIIVCADPLPSQQLPYPNEVVPDGPVPSNPFRSGAGALAAEGTPCAISHRCVVGFGPPILPLIKGAADVARRAFAKKPDKSGRVAIPLDDSDPPTGRIEP